MQKAATYLRSTKDRSDVSIDAQRRELGELAKRKGIEIVAEYSDAVESAKDEHRPDFQRLLTDMRRPDRPWTILLATDTSRISRRSYFAHAFRHECAKRQIDLRYSKLPEDLDPITEVIVHSSLTAMDEVHSLMSRQKGLAGMAENVRAGWRAGGRAPYGYRLVTYSTGTVRDGQPVTKTKLAPSTQAPIVARYLRARAAGATRKQAAAEAGLRKAVSSLVGIEWNALTYAGATVWGMNAETLPEGGYKGGHKRRPRADWTIQRDTHDALITWDEAITLIERLEGSDVGRAVSEAKSGNSDYLLTGLLTTPRGGQWWGSRRRYYRHHGEPGRYVRTEDVDRAVIDQVGRDMQSDAFIAQLLKAARSQSREDPTEDLRAALGDVTRKIDKATDLALALADPAPAHRKIDQLERERRDIVAQIERLEREHRTQIALRDVTEHDIRRALSNLWQDATEADTGTMKQALRAFIDRVELDPATLAARIHYRVALDRSVSRASPREYVRYATVLRYAVDLPGDELI